ncbi:MAG: hypothetical protein NC914_02230 [Candidatus Omnitrophica bacterium]|nr:hypothetical protein [Candidatus Omnitrophota bacterium]
MMTDKTKKEIIITSILVLVLIFVSMNTISRIKKKKGFKGVKAQAAAISKKGVSLKANQRLGEADSTQIEKAKENIAKLEREAQILKLKRDIFVYAPALSAEEISPSDLVLYGIIWDKANPIAIINEEIVKAGDKIGNNTVVKVEENSITLNDGIRDYKLSLSQE